MDRNLFRSLVITLAIALAALVAPAHASTAYCGITWGSAAKVHAGHDPGPDHITGIRAGRHACFDRVVIDLRRATRFDAYDVRYVRQVTQDGSGAAVPVRGGAKLQVVVRSTPYNAEGRVTYRPPSRSQVVDVAGYRTFRQVVWAGAFEGQTTLGIGTRARLPFRVVVLPGPAAGQVRVAIDVAHAW